MSVINQVLKDLAERTQESGDASTKEELSNLGVQDKIITNAPLWKRKIFWKVIVAVATITGSAIAGILIWHNRHVPPPLIQVQPIVIKKAVEQAPVAPPPAVTPPVPSVEKSPAETSNTVAQNASNKSEETKKESIDPPVRVMSPEQILVQEYNEIVGQIQSGNLSKAEAALKQFVAAHPDYEPAVYTLISVYLDSARDTLAAKLIQDSKGLLGDTPDLRMYQAQLLFNQGQDEPALVLLAERLPSIQAHPQYYTLLAGLYLKKGEYQSAERNYQQLLAIDASRSLWWFGLAESYYGQKRYQEAKHAYQQALDYNNCPPNVRIYIFDQLKLLE